MRKIISLVMAVFLFSGCVTTLRKSPDYDATISRIKIIAVMPPDIEVYKLTAGGVRELIDEWSDTSKKLVKDALDGYLASRYGFQIKFIAEDWLKANYKEIWKDNQALYNVASTCAFLHAYPGLDTFSSKLNNFDYTLGTEIRELSKVCKADALLFVYGVDHEATAGRTALLVWNILVGAATGVMILPTNPSIMTIGLVDANSGDIEWFKVSPPDAEYSFKTKEHIYNLVEWMTRDFLPKK